MDYEAVYEKVREICQIMLDNGADWDEINEFWEGILNDAKELSDGQ